MFIGEYRHNIDSKNRLIVPAKYREELNGPLVIVKGIDKCLNIYSEEQFEKILAATSNLPGTKKSYRTYRRNLSSKASETTVDSQGRIKIPTFLQLLADITKPCVIVGEYNYLSIWDVDVYAEFDAIATEQFEEIAEQITELIT
jgi:MraZ protein